MKLNNSWIRKNYLLILVSIFLFILPFFWFSNSELIFFHDEGLPLTSVKSFEMLHIWSPNYEFGVNTAATSKSIGFIIYYFLSSIFGYSLAEKLIYSILFIVGYLGFYLFAKNYLIKKDNKLLISIIFFSAYFSLEIIYSVIRVNYIFSRLFFISLFPLLLYFTLKLILERKKRTFIYFIITAIIFNAALPHPSVFIIMALTFPLIILYELYSQKKLNFKNVKFVIIIFFILGLIFSFSILPKILILKDGIENLGKGKGGILFELKDYSKFNSILTGITDYPVYPILGESSRIIWYTNQDLFKSNLFLAIISLIPLIVILLLIYKPPKKLYFYFILLILFLFLSKGLNQPFSYLYSFIVNHSSILDPFRYLEKWTIILPFLFGFILLIGLDNIHEKNKKLYNFLIILVTIPMIVIFAIFLMQGSIFPTNAHDLVLGKNFSSKIPLTELNKLIEINNYLSANDINDQNYHYRLIVYPLFNEFVYLNGDNISYIRGGSANPFNSIFNQPTISSINLQSPSSTITWKNEANVLINNENNNLFCSKLSQYNFKYVLANDYQINNPCLIEKFHNSKYYLYENLNWSSNIFSTDPDTYLNFKEITPYIYEINTNSNKLTINWEYRPGWIIVKKENFKIINKCQNNNYLTFSCELDKGNQSYYLVYYKDVLFKILLFISFLIVLLLAIILFYKLS